MKWVADLLKNTPCSMPIVFLTHVPFFTHWDDLTGRSLDGMICEHAADFHNVIRPYRNVKVVLQGHTHTLEDIHQDGVRYICGGAVSGSWWHGHDEGIAKPGFGVLTAKNGDIFYRYVPYGWIPTLF
jgi:hypothetical protein